MSDKGHYRKFIDKKLSEDKLLVIRQADKIIGEYEVRGFNLTLRQLYYQFVARGILPNSDKSYNWLGDVISDGRLCGLLSWTAIEDRNRSLMGLRAWMSPAECLREAARAYRTDRWAGQPWRPEVWVEKDALTGVIAPICNELDVDFFACKGYNSQSAQWRAGVRMAQYTQDGQRPIVFHLGDHDPSGLDMTRDNQERLSMFAGTPVLVVRLALNMNQVEQYNPPPNPAKLSDSRARDYIDKYGEYSWELDALSPEVIAKLISDAVSQVRDQTIWDEVLTSEARDVERMDEIIASLEDTEYDS